MKEKEIYYRMRVQLGKRPNCRFLWAKSAEWVGDQIVFSFSDQECVIPDSLTTSFSFALERAQHRPFKYMNVMYDEVPGSREDYEQYRCFKYLAKYFDIYGEDGLRDFVNKVHEKEVTPDD